MKSKNFFNIRGYKQGKRARSTICDYCYEKIEIGETYYFDKENNECMCLACSTLIIDEKICEKTYYIPRTDYLKEILY